MKPNIGIDDDARTGLAKGLSRLLADTYTLYLKTHNFHWNVTGPQFNQLHLMFMDQYTEMWTAVDEVAERIRALGEFAPGGYKAFAGLSSIKESEGHPDWKQMVTELVDGHETVIRTLRGLLPQVEKAGDESSSALISDRMRIHEKTAWMLRSLLG